MGDGPKNALVNIEGKAAEKLVERSADGVGGLFGPWQRKRMARANAEAVQIEAEGEARAMLIRAQGEIATAELMRRAKHRRVEEDAWHQHNMEQITSKARLLLTAGADETRVDDDWFANFYEKTKNVSDEQMQSMWARVLAGEVNTQGRFSRRTVNFLADLDRSDCEMFTKLCGYACTMGGGPSVLVYDPEESIYAAGASFGAISHLESIGLVQHSTITGYRLLHVPRHIEINYYGTRTILELEGDDNSFQVGKVLLTRVGRELASIAGGEPVPGFFDYLRGRWKNWIRPSPARDSPDVPTREGDDSPQ